MGGVVEPNVAQVPDPAPRASRIRTALPAVGAGRMVRRMEPVVGFEPTTDGLQNRCSTTELNWPNEAPVLSGIARALASPGLGNSNPVNSTAAPTSTHHRESQRESRGPLLRAGRVLLFERRDAGTVHAIGLLPIGR